jgi:hypothetical protein
MNCFANKKAMPMRDDEMVLTHDVNSGIDVVRRAMRARQAASAMIARDAGISARSCTASRTIRARCRWA